LVRLVSIAEILAKDADAGVLIQVQPGSGLRRPASRIGFVVFGGTHGDLTLPESPTTKRFFSGICVRLTHSAQDNTFTSYRAEIVPEFWLLTKKAQSRIFQQVTVRRSSSRCSPAWTSPTS
jgi:hypothetical protein